jgi:CubicO group peptidase (beta-lactamase class C family)
MPLYAVCPDPARVAARLLADDWLTATAAEYSDLDYLLWCLSVEKALARGYFELLGERVLTPLGVHDVVATPAPPERAVRCALPTGREVELARSVGLTVAELPPPARGEAQDGNCRFLGRPGGHAGLFATAVAVREVAREWMRPGRLFSSADVDGALGGTGRYALGWYRASESAAGRRLGPTAFGHDGFTGGTVWVVPERELVVVAQCHRAGLAIDLSEDRAELVDRLLDLEPGRGRPNHTKDNDPDLRRMR